MNETLAPCFLRVAPFWSRQTTPPSCSRQGPHHHHPGRGQGGEPRTRTCTWVKNVQKCDKKQLYPVSQQPKRSFCRTQFCPPAGGVNILSGQAISRQVRRGGVLQTQDLHSPPPVLLLTFAMSPCLKLWFPYWHVGSSAASCLPATHRASQSSKLAKLFALPRHPPKMNCSHLPLLW